MSDKKITIGYLGPEGTFSHEAILAFIEKSNKKEIKEAKLEMCPSFANLHALFFVREAHQSILDKVFIPIENSVGGSIGINVDALVSKQDPTIHVEAEFILPIHLYLGSISTNIKDIKILASHQQPIDQCITYIFKNLPPNTELKYTASTKEAVELTTHNPQMAAIASEKGFIGSNLNILAKNIQDNPDNATRFFLLGRDKTKPTGHDKTSIAITLPSDKAGALYDVLGVLAKSEKPINMTKIESRPTKDEMGEYWFFIDIEGHQDDEHIGKALDQIKKMSKEYRFLGSYPRFRK